MTEVVELAAELIARRSVTPDDAGCQALLAARLEAAGFTVAHHRFEDVDNLLAWHGAGQPSLCFLGHTDVVPPGDEGDWDTPPFDPQIVDGWLHGRGAADMKGSVAAMVVALERYVAAHPDHPGSLGLMLTSDEEGPAMHGVRRLVEVIDRPIDFCLVGEPSSRRELGDQARRGRRGSLHGHLSILGTQGHTAYPELAENPIHALGPLLTALTERDWDAGHPDFPPTSFQCSNVRAGTGANNVIPGRLSLDFNLRFCPASTAASLEADIRQLCDTHLARYELSFHRSGDPFHTPNGPFMQAVADAVRDACDLETEFNTGGGTSDGRFLAPIGAQVIELGPVNATIHKVNERVATAELEQLSVIYEDVIGRLLR